MTAPVVPPHQAPVPLGDLAIMAAFLVVNLAMWVFPTYSYEVSGDTLRVVRRVFGCIPLGSYRVRLSDILRVEPALAVGWVTFRVLGWASPFTPRGLLLHLRRPRHLFWNAIYISPPDPEAFAALLGRKLPSDAVVLARPAWAERKPRPLWATDAAVAAAALCLCACVPIATYAVPVPEKIGPATTVTLLVALFAVVLPVHLWLWLESLRSAAEHSSARHWLWFLMVSAFPGVAAVAYYVSESRPRRVRRTSAGDSATRTPAE